VRAATLQLLDALEPELEPCWSNRSCRCCWSKRRTRCCWSGWRKWTCRWNRPSRAAGSCWPGWPGWWKWPCRCGRP